MITGQKFIHSACVELDIINKICGNNIVSAPPRMTLLAQGEGMRKGISSSIVGSTRAIDKQTIEFSYN